MRANEGQHHAVATARATVLRRLNLRTWENCPWTFTPFNFNEVGLSCQPSEVELKDAFYTGVQASDSFPTTLITAQVIYVTETSIPATLLMDYMRNQSRAISDSKLDSLRKSAFNTIADFFEQFIKCVDLKTSPIFVTSAIWKNCQYTRKSRLHMLCISQQAPTWDKENSCMCYKEFASTPHRLRWGSCWCPWWSQPLFWHVFVHGVSVINGGGIIPAIVDLWIVVDDDGAQEKDDTRAVDMLLWGWCVETNFFRAWSERSWCIMRAREDKIGDQNTFGFHQESFQD